VITAKGIQLNVNPEWEVHPTQVKDWLDKHEDMLLLDCRRQNEWDTARIEGAKLIPVQDLDARVGEISEYKNRRVVIHCHSGVRSMNATAILRKHGFANVHSMAGGISAWSMIVDPSVPRY
jgi:rhodanese-related sulfurtransferase